MCQSSDYLHSPKTASNITVQDPFLIMGNFIDNFFDPNWGQATHGTNVTEAMVRFQIPWDFQARICENQKSLLPPAELSTKSHTYCTQTQANALMAKSAQNGSHFHIN